MQPGFVVADRFVIESPAGRGGMSEVFRAHDRVSNRTIALKVFIDREERAHDRFAREVELLSTLRNPTIVEYFAHGVIEDRPFLAMEWLEGEDLNARLQRGTLTGDEIVVLARRVSSALSVAHARGVVHRDVKPSNIFLVGGRIEDAKVIDFGIARVRGGPQFTRFGEALGTPAYMAPEQARGSGDVDSRADVFALGCVLFECLTGRPPFWADHPLAVMAKILIEEAPRITKLRDDLPRPLTELIERMLAKDPAARPSDGRAIADALAAMQAPKAQARQSALKLPADTSLTSRELQLLSVVFVGRVEPVPAAPHEAGLPTLAAEPTTGELDRVITEVLRYGGWAERLVDGSVVVTLPGRGAVLDQAATAARCALAVSRTMPNHPMALVTGRAEITGGFPVGDVIERGVRLLATAHARRAGTIEPRVDVPFGPTISYVERAIAIDDVTAGLLDRRFEIVGHGASDFALVGERQGTENARTLLGRPQAFVGRERELKRLLGLYETCLADQTAQVVLVTAPTGYGKSRFARELVDALDQRHPTPEILIGRSDPDRRQVDLGVLASAFRQLFCLQDQEGLDVARHRVRVRVGRHVARSERDRVAAFLGELVSVHFPLETHPLLAAVRADRVKLGDQIRAAVEDFFTAELLPSSPDEKRGGVVLILEDLHHADAATVNLLDGALRTFADAPLFVLGLAHPDIDEAFPQLWPTRALLRFELPRLAPAAAATLARHALGDTATPETIDRLVAQADGNAFYLEELVRAVASGRADRLPETVLAVIQARLDELDARDRRVLRACSIFGETFTVGGVRALLGPADADEVARALERLVDQELLVSTQSSTTTSGELGLGFRSTLVREAAYASLTADDRALGHRLAASWLERAGADRDAIVVANHLERAGDERLAAAWFAKAAETALEGNDFENAVAHGERGVRAGATGPLLGRIRLLQSEALRHVGKNDEMLERATEALAVLPKRTPPWWGAIANAILGALRLGRAATFEALFDEVKEGPYENLTSAATRTAHFLHWHGRMEVADAILASAMSNIGAFDEDPSKWAWGYRAHATRAMMVGDLGGFVEQLVLAIRAFGAAGDPRELAFQRIDLSSGYLELGLLSQARDDLLESLAVGERLGLAPVVAAAVLHLAWVESRLGNFSAANGAFDRVFPMYVEQKNRRMEALGRVYHARSLLDERRFEEALEAAMLASQLASANPSVLAYALSSTAAVLLACGRGNEALPMVRDTFASLSSGDLVLDEGDAFLRIVHAEAVMASGDEQAAKTALRDAHERLLVRAGRIRDASWRRSFLEHVPENARTIELVRAWH